MFAVSFDTCFHLTGGYLVELVDRGLGMGLDALGLSLTPPASFPLPVDDLSSLLGLRARLALSIADIPDLLFLDLPELTDESISSFSDCVFEDTS